MEELLCDAALKGDIESLHEIISRDSFILYKVCVGSFKGKNPLHVAVSTGQREFVLKLLEIKSDLAEVLDTELGAALHVASAKGHVEIVKALVKVSPKMCLSRDRYGYNPIHIAAMEGQVEVLEELVRTSPRSAQIKAVQGDTILHLCVKYYQFQCLQLLVDKIADPEFVNALDSDGNTILHLAVFENQLEMIKHVLSNSKIDVNAKNYNGQTALDICLRSGGNHTGPEIQETGPEIQETGSEIQETGPEILETGPGIQDILLNAGAKRREQAIVEVEQLEKSRQNEQIINVEGEEIEPKWQSKRRNTFLIVASLIATVTFQLAVTPPGGAFQDNSTGQAGSAILASTFPYAYYLVMSANTVAFLGSLSTIVLLIFALPELNKQHRHTRAMITWCTILAMDSTYAFSVMAIKPEKNSGWTLVIVAACVLWIFGIIPLVRRLSPEE